MMLRSTADFNSPRVPPPTILDDWCRVKLSKSSPDTSDFINASYMPVGINDPLIKKVEPFNHLPNVIY